MIFPKISAGINTYVCQVINLFIITIFCWYWHSVFDIISGGVYRLFIWPI